MLAARRKDLCGVPLEKGHGRIPPLPANDPPSGGIDAVAAAEVQIMLAYGEALAGTGKPLVASGSIGSPSWEGLGRPPRPSCEALVH